MTDSHETVGDEHETPGELVYVGTTPGGLRVMLPRAVLAKLSADPEALRALESTFPVFDATKKLEQGLQLTDEEAALLSKFDVQHEPGDDHGEAP